MSLEKNHINICELKSDKENGTLYTEITYFLEINNYFDYNMENIKIKLKIPQHTKLKEESLYINNEFVSLAKNLQVDINELNVNENLRVRYTVIVSSIPSNGKVENEIEFYFINSMLNKEEYSSNSVSTLIKGVDLILEKSLNNTLFYANDILELNLRIYNKGNIPALNINYTEILPENLEIKSFSINNIYTASNSIMDFNLGTLKPNSYICLKILARVQPILANTTSLVSKINYNFFDDYINEYLLKNTIENVVDINFQLDYIGTINGEKPLSIDKTILFIEDKGNVNFQITNLGTISIHNIDLYLESTKALSFKEFYCNGKKCIKNLEKIDKSFFNILSIEPGETINISFNVCLEDIQIVKSKFKIKMKYFIYNKILETYVERLFESNELNLEYYSLELSDSDNNKIENSINKYFCEKDDIMEVTIQFKNDGNLKEANLNLIEFNNKYIDFIPNTFTLNNKLIVDADIFSGVTINNINLLSLNVITYKFKLNEKTVISEIAIYTQLKFINERLNLERNIELISKPIRIIIPSIVAINNSNTISEVLNNQEIIYPLYLKNDGNIGIDNIALTFNVPKGIKLVDINVDDNNKFVNSIGNTVAIETIAVNEIFKLSARYKIVDKLHSNFISLSANINYLYKLENYKKATKNYITNNTTYKVINPSLDGHILLEKSVFLNSEIIKGILILKNNGNTMIKEIKPQMERYENSIEKIDMRFKESNNIDYIDIEKELRLPFTLKLNNIEFNKINLGLDYEYLLNSKIQKNSIIISSDKINIIKDDVILKINSNKKIYLYEETATFNLSINNSSDIDLNNSKISLTIPEGASLKDNTIYLSGNKILVNDCTDVINTGDINAMSILYLSYSIIFNKKSLVTENWSYFKLSGNYIDNINSRIINVEYYSDKSRIDVSKISLDTFIVSSKEVLLNNEEISYSTTIINTSTIPLKIKYSLITGNELIENISSRRINGDILTDDEYIISIDVNDGVTLENKFIYKHYRGINTSIAYGEIEIIDQKGLLDNNLIYTDKLITTLTNTTFKEMIIEEVIKSTNFTFGVKEILNIYVDSKILNYSIIPLYRDFNYYKKELSGYKLDFIGELNYSIEYTSIAEDEENDGDEEDEISEVVSIYNIKKLFNSSINLPEEFSVGENLNISISTIDINSKILTNSKIYLTVNLLVSANS